jgi:hypothetical protein
VQKKGIVNNKPVIKPPPKLLSRGWGSLIIFGNDNDV